MESIYCIKECVHWILLHEFTNVGLEFPDQPQIAVKVCDMLKEQLDKSINIIILQDSNKACGNCCIDERTAKPRNIEGVIHFGNSCLTPTQTLPVLYVVVSPVTSIHVENIVTDRNFEDVKKTDDFILTYDVVNIPFIDTIFTRLTEFFPSLLLSTMVIPDKAKLIFNEPYSDSNSNRESPVTDKNSGTPFQFYGRQVILPKKKSISDYNFIHIGENSPTLVTLQMRFSDKLFYIVNPSTYKVTVSNFVKVVISRSRKIEQVREAKTIGLLFTMVQGHQEILARLKSVIKASQRKYYTFFMGKINEAKLGNIVGVDVFVYVGCPESSLFDRVNQNLLYKNIVTPWELEVALNPSCEWTLNFELDFKELLKREFILEDQDQHADENCSDLDRLADDCRAVAVRSEGTLSRVHENAAGEAFAGLSWRGLDPNEESRLPLGSVVRGKSGIALEYEFEGIK